MEQLNPWEKRRVQIITWLLCSKRLKIPKYVDKIIAKSAFPLDLRGWINWDDSELHLCIWFRGPYEYIWIDKRDIHGKAPCNICLRPCALIINNEATMTLGSRGVVSHSCYLCPVHGILKQRANCNSCGKFGICEPCFEDLTSSKELLVNRKYINDISVPVKSSIRKTKKCLDGKIEYK